MARFVPEEFDADDHARIGKAIMARLNAGISSVEVVARSKDRVVFAEVRSWTGIRADRSNAKNTDPDREY